MPIMHNYVGLELIMLTGTISHLITRQKHICILDNSIPTYNQQNISYPHDWAPASSFFAPDPRMSQSLVRSQSEAGIPIQAASDEVDHVAILLPSQTLTQDQAEISGGGVASLSDCGIISGGRQNIARIAWRRKFVLFTKSENLLPVDTEKNFADLEARGRIWWGGIPSNSIIRASWSSSLCPGNNQQGITSHDRDDTYSRG